MDLGSGVEGGGHVRVWGGGGASSLAKEGIEDSTRLLHRSFIPGVQLRVSRSEAFLGIGGKSAILQSLMPRPKCSAWSGTHLVGIHVG